MYTFTWRDRSPPLSVEAWRQLARRCLPDLAWHYVDGGAEDQVTLAENMSGFHRWRLRQRCLTGVGNPRTEGIIAKTPLSLPVALAPTGGMGLTHWTGDVAAARGAEAAGTRLVLSTASSYTLEEVADATEHDHWFQLYPFGNREHVGALLRRAQSAGYSALFVTVDVPVVGNREGERSSGMASPWQLTPGRAMNMLMHPRWLRAVLKHKRISPIHYRQIQASGDVPPPTGLDIVRRMMMMGAAEEAIRATEAQSRYMQTDLHWEDLTWIRDRWKGALYLKGVLDTDDAERVIDEVGANGVVVSNHGGRQLDRTLASIDALPAIAARIGNRAEIYLDGGVRRGTDVITALCLGAHGVFIGRPYLYGLAAAGEQGVQAIIEIFKAEISRALVLMGCPSTAALNRSWLLDPDLRWRTSHESGQRFEAASGTDARKEPDALRLLSAIP
jgi:isopentenyl diphosphate isomerase/L-lactate dehydrogenase-like FMN-dependent dehydrogenase